MAVQSLANASPHRYLLLGGVQSAIIVSFAAVDHVLAKRALCPTLRLFCVARSLLCAGERTPQGLLHQPRGMLALKSRVPCEKRANYRQRLNIPRRSDWTANLSTDSELVRCT